MTTFFGGVNFFFERCLILSQDFNTQVGDTRDKSGLMPKWLTHVTRSLSVFWLWVSIFGDFCHFFVIFYPFWANFKQILQKWKFWKKFTIIFSRNFVGNLIDLENSGKKILANITVSKFFFEFESLRKMWKIPF